MGLVAAEEDRGSVGSELRPSSPNGGESCGSACKKRNRNSAEVAEGEIEQERKGKRQREGSET